MPDLNTGVLQGDIVPIYLAIRALTGELIPQPPDAPTIAITFTDPETNIIHTRIEQTQMSEIIPGQYYYLWRIPLNEFIGEHRLLLRGVIDNTPLEATDSSFVVSDLFQVEDFEIRIKVTERHEVCYPEVTDKPVKCRRRGPLPASHMQEADIGLDDRVLEGAFRFGEFPNQVVDRRVSGRFEIGYGARSGLNSYINSRMPGGGPAHRLRGINEGQVPPHKGGFRY